MSALRSGAQRVVAAKCRLDQSRMSPYLGMMVVGISPILALAFVVPRFGTHATLISIEADVGWIMALVESGLPGWHADQCSDASRGGTHFHSVAEVPRLSGEVKITCVPLRAGPRASAPTGAGTP